MKKMLLTYFRLLEQIGPSWYVKLNLRKKKTHMLETNLHQSWWSPPAGMMLGGSDKENPICFSFVRLIKAIWAILFFAQGNDGNCPVIYWVCPLANKLVVKVWEKILMWYLFYGSCKTSWNSVKPRNRLKIFPRQIW